MPDHDPGNAGGSVTIPPSPVPPSRTEYVCETCGHAFEIHAALETHRSVHLGPHPVLVCQGKPVVSTWVISDAAVLSELRAEHAVEIELAGELVPPRRLRQCLIERNGRSPAELVLIGHHGDVRRTYRVQVLVFEPRWLASIDAAYCAELNVEQIDGRVLNGFYEGRPWSERPERTYAEALASFRTAIWMRNDLIAGGSDVVAHSATTYRHHLADARAVLQSLDQPLALTAAAAGAFIENDFSWAPRSVVDTRVRRAIALFRSLTLGTALRWPAEGRPGTKLVLHAHTGCLLNVVEALAANNGAAVDRLLAELAARTQAVQDVLCAKKVMALALHRRLPWAAPLLLAGDPTFASMLEEMRH